MPEKSIEELVNRIKTGGTEIRLAAVTDAASAGAAAIAPLAEIMAGDDKPAARAAQEAVRRIVYSSARSGSGAKAVTLELVKLIDKGRPRGVRSDAMLLLRQVGTVEAVEPIANLLDDREMAEEARMALERLPFSSAEHLIKQAAGAEQSLRRRKQSMKDTGIR